MSIKKGFLKDYKSQEVSSYH